MKTGDRDGGRVEEAIDRWAPEIAVFLGAAWLVLQPPYYLIHPMVMQVFALAMIISGVAIRLMWGYNGE